MGQGYVPSSGLPPKPRPKPIAVRTTGRARKTQTGHWTPITLNDRRLFEPQATPAKPTPAPRPSAKNRAAAAALMRTSQMKQARAAQPSRQPVGDKTLEKQIAAALAGQDGQPSAAIRRHKLDKPESVDIDQLLADLGS